MDAMKIAKLAGGLTTLLLLLAQAVVAPLSAAGTPVIGAGGIVNGATNRSPDLPGGDIAQGSLFAIYGVEIGPAVGVGVTEFPLSNNLAGVEITVTQGGTTVNAIPIFVLAGQINAIMPSNAPLGEVQVRVICNGVVSEPETVTVVQTSIGIFTRDASGAGPGSITDLPNFNLNTAANSAMPNEAVTIWATGVAGIEGPDNIPPGSVKGSPGLRDFKDEIGLEVFVGGQPVNQIFYAGRSAGFAALDQIIVELAANVALGCNTPVYMTARGVTSNTVTMATSADGGECSDEPDNPIISNLGGGKNASIVLARIDATVDLGDLGLLLPAPVKKALGLGKGLGKGFFGNVTATVDVGVASFMEIPEGETIDPTILSDFFNMPPYGMCASFTTEGLDIIDMGTGGGAGRPLAAGSGFTITRNADNATRTLTFQNGTAAAILGDNSLGGLVSTFLDMSPQPLFLNAGSYTAAGPGGSEIGPWTVDFTLAPPVVFENSGSFGTVNRGSDQTVEWSGGDDTQFIEVAFVNVTNVQAEVPTATGVACLARPSDRSITVASSLLNTIPASTPPDANGDITSLGVVLVGGTQFKDLATFTAPELDGGVVTSATLGAATTVFQ